MENQKFDLVRQILRSPLFHSQPQEEKLNTLNSILNTGEVKREDLLFLINEALEENKEKSSLENEEVDFERIGRNLESLDYVTFLTFVRKGKIEGKDLIRLCNTSRKLNEYCNRSFQIKNKNGIYVGEPIPQYLFVTLLNNKGIKLLPGQNPREVYKRRVIGGRVYSFGSNSFMQLGFGDEKNRSIPTLIPHLDNIVQASAGQYHSLLSDNKGQVWGFGNNETGQLGLGDRMSKNRPTLIPRLNYIIEIRTGHSHSLALDNLGNVWGFGSNANGQLGLEREEEDDEEEEDNVLGPVLIASLNNIVHISAGRFHSLALDNQGRVWGFGYNHEGQLGLGDKNKRYIPTLIPNLNNIIQINAGNYHSLALDNQGKVWSFGANRTGQLGSGNTEGRLVPILIPKLNNIVRISAGGQHSLVLDNRGKVWSFGNNYYGQLGLGNTQENFLSPVAIPDLSNIVQISAGGNYSLVLDNQGKVWSFGYNIFGQLGLGDGNDRLIPTLIPDLNDVFQVSAGASRSLILR